ncbi:MAG: hypothetical protein AAF628_28710 [Planctomycetota bacterium]
MISLQDPAAVHTEETFRLLAPPELWQLVLIVLPLVIGFAWWSYGGLRRLAPRPRVLLATLRGLAIAIILFAAFQPAIEQVRYTTVQTQVCVLVDDSASMRRRDTYPDEDQNAALREAALVEDLASHSRTDLVAKVLGGTFMDQLSEQHTVRLFRFSREPRLIGGFGELAGRGPRTHIGDALDLLRASPSATNLDALILVSDGRSNGGVAPVEAAQKYRADDVPVYTIGVGDPTPPRNVRLVGPPGPKEALVHEEIAFELTVSAERMEGRSVPITLSASRDGGPYLPIANESALLGGDGIPVKVRLFHGFDQPGDYTLRFEAAPFPEETSHEDNVATRFLRVDDQRIRVLYIDDVPRWEYRYVKNALLRVDPSIEVQVYLFDASRDFRQEATDTLRPLDELPRTTEELREYHVILIGDVPPERLGATEEERNDWLEELVAVVEFGSGVGFMTGERAMPERYRGSPLEDLLPVVLEDPLELHKVTLNLETTDDFRPALENPTQPHDIAALTRNLDRNQRLWERYLQPWTYYYPVQKAKAGAEVLLRHPDDANAYGQRVLAAASEYPRGRTFYIATDETWRWRKPFGEKYHDTFWRNSVRWLAGGRLRRRDDRVELRLDKVIVETGEQVRAVVRVLDDELQPIRAQEFAVYLRRPDAEPIRRPLRAVPADPGTFQGSFTMDAAGSVSVLVHENESPSGRVLAREDVLVKVPDREMARSSQDRETLEQIASASKNGRYVSLSQAGDLLEDFQERRAYEREVDRKTRPLWDTIWTLLAVLGVLGLEWVLRKRERLV